MKKVPLLLFTLAVTVSLQAAEYHFSLAGHDQDNGSKAKPFKTMSKAAFLAQPGDTITVYEGVYREWVNPPRGGTSDALRIVYQAAPGEKVAIKGSERVKGWTQVEDDTWILRLPNTFFGDFNPYSDLIQGDWYDAKRPHHSGAVYLNGHWLKEASRKGEVLKSAATGVSTDTRSELMNLSRFIRSGKKPVILRASEFVSSSEEVEITESPKEPRLYCVRVSRLCRPFSLFIKENRSSFV